MLRQVIDRAIVEETPEREYYDLNLGPSHPAMHGILENRVKLDGERIVDCESHIGYCHRSFEKLAEHYSYNQVLTITDRMNYVSAMANNIGWTLAAEKLLGIEVPKRVQYVRVIMLELNRIIDHLVRVGILGVDSGAYTGFLYFFEQRERSYKIIEKLTGARLTTTFGRVGGLDRPLYPEFKEDIYEWIGPLRKVLKEFHTMLTRNRIFIERLRDVSPMNAERALEWGYTGPMLRAAGVEYDLRKHEPYSSYEDFDFEIPLGGTGDAYDRYMVCMEEMEQSIRIIEQAVENLPEGPHHADVPEVYLPEKKDVYSNMEAMIYHFKIIMHGICPPAGEVYQAIEAPNGELGFYCVSDGGPNPYRLHFRSPCLYYYQSIEELLRGGLIADAIMTISSINVIAGELER
ncbi:MAG: NADH-quinone oxidoreductase subunit D [Calditrichaeota bacterium]|nr:NADH-quinone oxidoreductase subunit D [Calditrichota bacterium]